jgi:hypothetical protein
VSASLSLPSLHGRTPGSVGLRLLARSGPARGVVLGGVKMREKLSGTGSGYGGRTGSQSWEPSSETRLSYVGVGFAARDLLRALCCMREL